MNWFFCDTLTDFVMNRVLPIVFIATALSPTAGGFLFRATVTMPLVWAGFVDVDTMFHAINW